MTSPDSQERLKEEAKNIQTRIGTLIKDKDPQARMLRAMCIYAGLITETLLEYEEPDVIMEQAFHRIADLLHTDPADSAAPDALMPLATVVDHDTELGRLLARNTAEKLPKGLDDLHEIAIALIINDVPLWEKDGFVRDRMLRLMVECVISSLTFEMATQDFCDLLVENFMTDNAHTTAESLVGIGAVGGYYFQVAQRQMKMPDGIEKELMHVMVRESLRHGTPGTKNWGTLAAANDVDDKKIPYYLKEIRPAVEEFFVLIGLDDPLGRAVSIAKTAGRMVAVISVEDVGQIHPSIAKSLAKTGMILGMQYKEHVIPA